MKHLVYTVRTSDDRPIIWDAAYQFSAGIELHFATREIAEKMLIEIATSPLALAQGAKFKIVEHYLDDDEIEVALTADQIHAKAEAEKTKNNKA